ncbi:MAG: CCA tRNA nucleotidyltransferase [Blautia sp.]|nr:CCA tRNA nucleotidyltransferase [Blautia sp.]
MQIILPKNVNKIIHVLEENGFEAYAVGGCIRDSLLGRTPNDWDITTSALPEQVKALFKKTIDTGIQHGTVTILLDKEGYEVTTYRLDGEYEDSRHPKEVTFTALLSEDLKRRDFTINALAYNEKEGLVDLFGGQKDMEEKVIRCVGDPLERFTEDALRILRAVRFAAQLGFSIEERTQEAIGILAGNLEHISAERIQAELVKLAVSPHPEELYTAYETGITRVILPELDVTMETEQKNPHHCHTVGAHLIESMRMIEPDKVLRLAMLLHDIGKPVVRSTGEDGVDHFFGHADVSAQMAHDILKRLKFDNDTLYTVEKLIAYHDYRPEISERAVRRFLNKTGKELFPLILKVQRADIAAQSDYQRAEKEERLKEVELLAEKIFEENQCFSLKDLAVSGRDLIDDGMEPGKQLGEVLSELLGEVLRDPAHNTKEYLLEYSRTLRRS